MSDTGTDDLNVVQRLINWRVSAAMEPHPPNETVLKLQQPFVDLVEKYYFRVEVDGWERVPDETCLVIGVHSGGALTMDAWSLVNAWQKHFDGKRFLHGTAHDVLMASPGLGDYFRAVGVIAANRKSVGAALAQGEDPDGDAATLDVMAVLQKFSGVRPHPEAFVEALEPLQPRLYSISSSHNATPGKLSLTVDCVRYVINKRKRLGLASTFLAERINPGDELKVYVQKAHGFALPQDPKTPIIMIGPGTGIAPFRAFLHDRRATGAPGKNWLFFGHQRSDCDFFYADELNAMKTSGLLTRLSLAWSRDGDKKFYVQDRMREVGRELWTWLAEGANIYVCGDAKRMAKDVERALVDIVAQFGARTTDEAVSFVGELKKNGRFQQDVY